MLKQLAMICCTLCLCACAAETVSPWQRGNLAKKVMVRDASSQQSAFEDHAYSSKEGTSGGYSVGGGGCGCN